MTHGALARNRENIPWMSLSEEEWNRLRKTIQSGVANGVLIAGLVLMLLSFALGMLTGSVRM